MKISVYPSDRVGYSQAVENEKLYASLKKVVTP